MLSTIIGFEDVKTTGASAIEKGLAALPSTYDGLEWKSSSQPLVIDPEKYEKGEYRNDGVGHGVTSGTQDMMFNEDLLISVSHGTFSLESVWITSGFDSSDFVVAKGFDREGNEIYIKDIWISEEPEFVKLGFKKVASVSFQADNEDGNSIILDDLAFKGVKTQGGGALVGINHANWGDSGQSFEGTHSLFAGQVHDFF